MPAVGHAEGSLAGFTVLICPGEMLNAVSDAHLSVSNTTRSNNVFVVILAAAEKLLIIAACCFSPHVLQWHHIVVEDNLLLVLKGHRFVCARRGDNFVLKRGNLGLCITGSWDRTQAPD